MNDQKSTSTHLTIKYALLQSSLWGSFATIWGFAVVYLHFKGFTNTQIGIILSIAAILSIFLQPIIASFIDKYKSLSLKFILLLLISSLIFLAFALYFIPNIFILITLIYILIGCILLSMPSLTYSFALEYMNSGVSFNFGLARGIGSLSFAIMSYFIGIIIEAHSPLIIIPIFAITCIIMFLSTYSFKSPYEYLQAQDTKVITTNSNKTTYNNSHNKNGNNKGDNIVLFFKNNPYFFLLLFGFSMLFISHNFINTYHINIIKYVGGGDADMGLSVAVAAAAELPIMAGFIYLMHKVKCSNLLKISAVSFFIKATLILLAPNVFIVILSQLFQMFAFALFTLSSVYYVNDVMDESNKARGQALIGASTMGIGGTLGNFIGGKVLDLYPVKIMLITGVLTSLIGFFVVFISTNKLNTKKSPTF